MTGKVNYLAGYASQLLLDAIRASGRPLCLALKKYVYMFVCASTCKKIFTHAHTHTRSFSPIHVISVWYVKGMQPQYDIEKLPGNNTARPMFCIFPLILSSEIPCAYFSLLFCEHSNVLQLAENRYLALSSLTTKNTLCNKVFCNFN